VYLNSKYYNYIKLIQRCELRLVLSMIRAVLLICLFGLTDMTSALYSKSLLTYGYKNYV